MGVFVLFQVLPQTEWLLAEAALKTLLHVVLFVVALQGKLGLEVELAPTDVALEHSALILGVERRSFAYERRVGLLDSLLLFLADGVVHWFLFQCLTVCVLIM